MKASPAALLCCSRSLLAPPPSPVPVQPRCTAQARSSAAALRLVPYRAISIYFSPGAAASSNPAALGAKDAACLDLDRTFAIQRFKLFSVDPCCWRGRRNKLREGNELQAAGPVWFCFVWYCAGFMLAVVFLRVISTRCCAREWSLLAAQSFKNKQCFYWSEFCCAFRWPTVLND